jgi:hypothetical protein
VLTCPVCDARLQTLDLPCPVCTAFGEDADVADQLLHQYSKSFKTRWAFRPNMDAFVATVNRWLYQQPGLFDVYPELHLSPTGTVREATLTCRGTSRDPGLVFQLHRLPLATGGPFPIRRRDLGEALNDWADRHPEHDLVGRFVLDPAGVPMEVWILSVVPREVATLPAEPEEPAGFMGVHRLPGPILLTWGALFTASAIAALQPVVVLTSVPIAAFGGWLTRRFPLWRRRSRVPAPQQATTR